MICSRLWRGFIMNFGLFGAGEWNICRARGNLSGCGPCSVAGWSFVGGLAFVRFYPLLCWEIRCGLLVREVMLRSFSWIFGSQPWWCLLLRVYLYVCVWLFWKLVLLVWRFVLCYDAIFEVSKMMQAVYNCRLAGDRSAATECYIDCVHLFSVVAIVYIEVWMRYPGSLGTTGCDLGLHCGYQSSGIRVISLLQWGVNQS